jgi:hypothetical protein
MARASDIGADFCFGQHRFASTIEARAGPPSYIS